MRAERRLLEDLDGGDPSSKLAPVGAGGRRGRPTGRPKPPSGRKPSNRRRTLDSYELCLPDLG